MKFEYSKSNHTVGDSYWHIEWCTKYRLKMFVKFKYKSLCEACIRKTARQHRIKIVELSVMPEHVHLIAKVPTNMAIDFAVQLLKGGSAYLFFKNHPNARFRYPRGNLWSRGKFRTSVGFADLPTTLNYIRNQETLHKFPSLDLYGNLGL